MIHYNIAGLHIQSEFTLLHGSPLPEDAHKSAEIYISIRDDLGQIPNPHFDTDRMIAGTNDFMFTPIEGLSYRIRNGTSIAISKEDHIDDRDVHLFLIGSAWGVLLHQRDLIPLHCSAIGVSGHAIAFIGQSGAGKSTLGAGLSRRGYGHICDDVCLINPADPELLVHPMPKGIKLWREAAQALNIDMGASVSTHPDLDKFYVSAASEPISTPHHLTAIYVLRETDKEQAYIKPLSGSQCFSAVLENIYRQEWVGIMGNRKAVFTHVLKILENVTVFAYYRQKDLGKFDKNLDVLEHHFMAL